MRLSSLIANTRLCGNNNKKKDHDVKKIIAAQGSNKINWRKKGNEQLSKVVEEEEVVVNVFKHLSLT